MNQGTRSKVLALLLGVVFFLAEFTFINPIEAISPYALYGFEILWIALVVGCLRGFYWFNKDKMIRWIGFAALTGFIGVWVQLFAGWRGITIPFDFENNETLILLLLIGPVLEELLFRAALWKVTEIFVKNRWILVAVTALLFSYSHYRMIYNVPEEYYRFVKYQAIYTFILGAICGLLRSSFGVTAAILAHLLFNFGFWLAK